MGRLALLLLLALCLSSPALAVVDLNQPGQAVEVTDHLVAKKTNIVEFVANWSRTCSRYEVALARYEKTHPNVVVLRVQVKNMHDAVATRYGLTQLPYYKIYDKEGQLVCQGQRAFVQVVKRIEGN